MWFRGSSPAATLAAVAAAGILACGGGEAPAPDTTPGTGGSPEVRGVPAQSDLALPGGVPDRATGPADRRAVAVIRRWLGALNRGEVERAARYFALPSKFQNVGTPVLTIDSDRERVAINASLMCGARAIRSGGAGRYTIVTFRLIERPGGDCGRGTGETARGAIHVHAGRIREWYRLPDEPGGDPPAPPAPSGPEI